MTEMHPPFVLGHGKTIDVLGVVSCRWNFAEEHGVSIIQLFVLQDCIFDVILGCDFLTETEPFVNHLDSLHRLVKDGLSGLNVVMWVKAKQKTKAKMRCRTHLQTGNVNKRRQKEMRGCSVSLHPKLKHG